MLQDLQGQVKTVCINAIIASLCYHSSPEDVRFIMVDPKIVEMKVYNDLPHMLIPVVTEPKKVPGAFKMVINRNGKTVPNLFQNRGKKL